MIQNKDEIRKKFKDMDERNIFFKDEPVRWESCHSRYILARKYVSGTRILEIGCSNGWGSRYFLDIPNVEYLGVDNEPGVIDLAKQEYGDKFICSDINNFDYGYYDTIIAMEVIEHIPNGLELCERLKQYCNTLIVSVPYNENKGHMGYHCLHNLKKENFIDFQIVKYISPGKISDDVPDFNVPNMFLVWKKDITFNKNNTKFSIIIPTCGSKKGELYCIKECLDSVLQFTDFSNKDKDIHIVFNGKLDSGIYECLKYYEDTYPDFIFVHYLNNKKALGHGISTNYGIKHSSGNYVVLLNDDVILLGQDIDFWINRIYNSLLKNDRVMVSGPLSVLLEQYNKYYTMFFCCMFRREVFDKIGYLEEEYDKYHGYMNDIDFCMRLFVNGYEANDCSVNMVYNKDSNMFTGKFPIYHVGGASTRSDSQRNMKIRDSSIFAIKRFRSELNFKIFDCFPMFNELELLKIRLEELYDVVDYFVIVESNYTHSGKKKPLNFSDNKEMFSKYLDKIKYFVYYPEEMGHNTNDAWLLEINQRNKIISVLEEFCGVSDNDVIIVSDLDEIPRGDSIYEYIGEFTRDKFGVISGLYMNMYYYYLNAQFQIERDSSIQSGKETQLNNDRDVPYISRYVSLKNYRDLTNNRRDTYKKYWIRNAGWHFSYMGGPNNIIEKIKSFAHQEYNKEDNLISDNILSNMSTLQDIYNRGDDSFTLTEVDVDESFPKLIYNNKDYYIQKEYLYKKDKDVKVIDTFIFFNEFDILKIRLEELYDVVDKFIIVESNYTHSGKKKPLYFQENKNKFSKYLDKIEYGLYIPSEKSLEYKNPWIIEAEQNNFVSNILRRIGANKEDIILSSDADEIPKKDVIDRYTKNFKSGIVRLRLCMYYYYLNLYVDSWESSFICRYEDILNRGEDICNIRRSACESGTMDNAGWHFSYIGGPYKIVEKIKSFTHQEYNRYPFTDIGYLICCLSELKDPYGRQNLPNKFDLVEVNENYPTEVFLNKKEYYRKGLLFNNYLDRDTLFKHYCLRELVEFIGESCEGMDMAEIGCWVGHSTSFFASKFKKVYAIDPWKPGYNDIDPASNLDLEKSYLEFKERCFYCDNIEIYKKTSLEASREFKDESLDFVYIDANHIYDSVVMDINLWLPKIKKDGYIGGHDYCYLNKDGSKEHPWIDVFDAVNDTLGEPEIIFGDSSWCFRKSSIKKDVVKKPKYSIIIPTYNHLEDCLKPCLEGVLETTNLSDVEILIIVNGCTDGTLDYLNSLHIDNMKLIVDENPLGYTKATNLGIKESKGYYIVLLNNDAFLYKDQAKNYWLDRLNAPFIENSKIGITGIHTLTCPYTEEEFVVFLCCMISRKCIEDVGLLDEYFNPGYGEDIDFNIRAKRLGYSIFCVDERNLIPDAQLYGGSFPLYHKGESTVHDLKNWDFIKERNCKYLVDKYVKNNEMYNNIDVSVVISTKNRYDSTLLICLQSVINQSYLPKKIYIFDDNDNPKDLRELPVFNNLFRSAYFKGIDYEVIFGKKQGQVANYITSLEICKTDWIWRVDDDNVPDQNVLMDLVNTIKEKKCAAVGGLILDPNIDNTSLPCIASNDIEKIYYGCNIQWYKHPNNDLISVDHLYSSFLFNKSIAKKCGGYCDRLSRVGHREETIFTYQMKKAGYELYVNPNAITWHYRYNGGGIRSVKGDYYHDECIFEEYLSNWGIIPRQIKLFVLDNGIGDHFCFKHLIPEIKEKYKEFDLILAVCYRDVFFDIDGFTIISIKEAAQLIGNLDGFNLYKKGFDTGQIKNITDLYREIYEL